MNEEEIRTARLTGYYGKSAYALCKEVLLILKDSKYKDTSRLNIIVMQQFKEFAQTGLPDIPYKIADYLDRTGPHHFTFKPDDWELRAFKPGRDKQYTIVMEFYATELKDLVR